MMRNEKRGSGERRRPVTVLRNAGVIAAMAAFLILTGCGSTDSEGQVPEETATLMTAETDAAATDQEQVPDQDAETPSSEGDIGIDRAKEIALQDAGVSAEQANFSRARMERDDGRSIYEVKFYVEYVEYEYDIDAVTGEILDFEMDEPDGDD